MNATVGQAILKVIAAEGVDHVFCVPGESYLPVLDAFHEHPEIQLVTTHHEEGAGFMAHAWARSTGRPGVFMVTRGPGVTHAAIALHAAQQDSVPMVLFVGQVARWDQARESFQELDLVGLGRLLGKDAVELNDPARAVEQVQRAFYLARSGRPGPVVVSLPEDVGYEATSIAGVRAGQVPVPVAADADVQRAAEAITGAERVAIVVGGGMSAPESREAAVRLAEATGAVTYCGWRRFDSFPNTHAQFAGNLPWLSADLLEPLRSADVIVALGTRWGDFTSLSYSLPGEGQQLVQVDLDASSMAAARHPDVAMVGDAADVARRLVDALAVPAAVRAANLDAATAAHQRYLSASEGPEQTPQGVTDLPKAIRQLRETVPADTVITSDAGAFAGYLNRYYRWTEPVTFLGTTSGSMGYAVPSAIGAKLALPDRPVVSVAGDGGFAMTMSEVHTAVRLGLAPLIFLVFDNGTYGTIRAHQSARFPGREIGVDQGSADVAAIAEGMGALGIRCESNGAFAAALEQALSASVPTVIHAITSPSQIGAWSG